MKVTVYWIGSTSPGRVYDLLSSHSTWQQSWAKNIEHISGDWYGLSLSDSSPKDSLTFMRTVRSIVRGLSNVTGTSDISEGTPLELAMVAEIDRLEMEMVSAINELKKSRRWLRDKHVGDVRVRLERALRNNA